MDRMNLCHDFDGVGSEGKGEVHTPRNQYLLVILLVEEMENMADMY